MFDKKADAALRHLGVALIDIDYAIAELSRTPGDGRSIGLEETALGELIAGREQIRELAARMAGSLVDRKRKNDVWVRRLWPQDI